LFEHDFASRALQFGFERAMAQAISHRQRFVEVWSRRGLDRQPRPRSSQGQSLRDRQKSECSAPASSL
jgi:hypothetical protein